MELFRVRAHGKDLCRAKPHGKPATRRAPVRLATCQMTIWSLCRAVVSGTHGKGRRLGSVQRFCAVRSRNKRTAKIASMSCGGAESTRQSYNLCREVENRAHGKDVCYAENDFTQDHGKEKHHGKDVDEGLTRF